MAKAKVLIIDDEKLARTMLTDLLRGKEYTVITAEDGPSGLAAAQKEKPNAIILDVMMPGMDGFEVARRLKAGPETAHIPIVFMTGLTETEHVVAAFQAGGIDYVTKPIKPKEVLARIAAHMQSARQARQARNVLDAFGHATMAIHIGDARVVWQTPLARELMQRYYASTEARVPPALLEWLGAQVAASAQGSEQKPLTVVRGPGQLVFTLQKRTTDDDWLIVMREVSDAATVEAMMQAFRLTLREAEVLYWVVKGKTNRDIGDILGLSPRTVTKHLEHVFQKQGVETRTAAANLAMSRVGGLARQ